MLAYTMLLQEEIDHGSEVYHMCHILKHMALKDFVGFNFPIRNSSNAIFIEMRILSIYDSATVCLKN